MEPWIASKLPGKLRQDFKIEAVIPEEIPKKGPIFKDHHPAVDEGDLTPKSPLPELGSQLPAMLIGIDRRTDGAAEPREDFTDRRHDALSAKLDDGWAILDMIIGQIGCERRAGSDRQGGPSPFQVWSTAAPEPTTPAPATAFRGPGLPFQARPSGSNFVHPKFFPLQLPPPNSAATFPP